MVIPRWIRKMLPVKWGGTKKVASPMPPKPPDMSTEDRRYDKHGNLTGMRRRDGVWIDL